MLLKICNLISNDAIQVTILYMAWQQSCAVIAMIACAKLWSDVIIVHEKQHIF